MIKTHTAASGARTGQQVRCTATVRGCPLGGDDEHMYFDNAEQAEEYNQLELAREHGSQAGDFSKRDEARLNLLTVTSDRNRARNRISELSKKVGRADRYYPVVTTVMGESRTIWERSFAPVDPSTDDESLYLEWGETIEYQKLRDTEDKTPEVLERMEELEVKSDTSAPIVEEIASVREELRRANGVLSGVDEVIPVDKAVNLLSSWNGSTEQVYSFEEGKYYDPMELHDEVDLWEVSLY